MSALYHVKSNTVADFTGTVTGFNSQGSTTTLAATNLVRPGDWNSAHMMAGTISGNTSGQSTYSGATNVVFQGGNNVTLSLATAASAATVVISAGAGLVSTYIPYYPASTGASTMGATGTSTASAHFFPVSLANPVNFNMIRLLQTVSYISSSVAGSQTISSNYGIYSNNAGTLSQISSGSFSMALSNSSVSATLSFPTGTGTGGYTYGTTTVSATNAAQSLFGTAGNRIFGLAFSNTMSLSEGLYWIGVHQRMSSSSANVGLVPALAGNVMAAAQNAGPIGSSTAAFTGGANALVYEFGWGPYTSTGSAGYSGTNIPASAFLSGIANTVTQMPMMTFIRT